MRQDARSIRIFRIQRKKYFGSCLRPFLASWFSMASENCYHGKSAPIGLFNELHHSQAGSGRHKCAICAYDQGYRRGLSHPTPPAGDSEECQVGKHAPSNMLADLPDSQAGAGRHQCLGALVEPVRRKVQRTTGAGTRGWGRRSVLGIRFSRVHREWRATKESRNNNMIK